MTQPSESKPTSLITPEQIFIAYAKKKDAEGAFPKTQSYHEKRWRLISGLFEIPLDLGLESVSSDAPGKMMLEGLMNCRRTVATLRPVTAPILGQWPALDREIEARHEGVIVRHAAALRSEYDKMGGELIESLFPGIEKKSVAVSRLYELGLPKKAPDPNKECWEWLDEHWDEKELASDASDEKTEDDISPVRMDELKLSEEETLRQVSLTEYQMDQIRLRVIGMGLATDDTVDSVIYEMPVALYLELAGDFPKVSRVHFSKTPPVKTPALKKEGTPAPSDPTELLKQLRWLLPWYPSLPMGYPTTLVCPTCKMRLTVEEEKPPIGK